MKKHPGVSAKFTFELEGGSKAVFKPKMCVHFLISFHVDAYKNIDNIFVHLFCILFF